MAHAPTYMDWLAGTRTTVRNRFGSICRIFSLVVPWGGALVDGIDDRRVQFPTKRLDACQRDVAIQLLEW